MRSDVQPGEAVLACDDLDATIEWFAAAGMRLDMITPADSPHTAVMSGHGLRIRLAPVAGARGDAPAAVGHLRLPRSARPAGVDQAESIAPNGTRVEWVDPGGATVGDADATGPLAPPIEAATVVTRTSEGWEPGRAGMGYRDLIPGRLGGHVIASHIHISDGGPVADYVHHHHIDYQLIYCWRGSADLVYEDQGPPLRFEAGDCVLQPPHIRHRVLATSADFDVIEIASPATHDTLVDHDLTLPTERANSTRVWGGQRFVHHRAAEAEPHRRPGTRFLARDLELGPASGGAVAAFVVTPDSAGPPGEPVAIDDGSAAMRLRVVLSGAVDVVVAGVMEHLGSGDAIVVPAGEPLAVAAWTDNAEWLEVLGR